MTNFVNSFGIILFATLVYATPLLYAALGSCFSEVSGVVNIGIEGMMTAGAFTGTVVAYFTGSPWLGFLCGGLAGAFFGMLHAIATVNLGADQTIAGTAINMLGPGIVIMLAKILFNSTDTVPLTQAQKIPKLFAGVFARPASACGFAPAASIPRPARPWASTSSRCALPACASRASSPVSAAPA